MGVESNSNALWTKNFVFVTVAKLFSTIAFMIYSVILASYALSAFPVTSGEAGFAVGIFIIAALIARVLSGRYVDIIGRKKIAVAGGIVFFIISFVYLLPVSYGGFLVVRFAHGLAFGVLSNTTNVIATGFIPASRMGEGLGYFSLATTLAQAVGPLLGMSVLRAFSFEGVFILCAVLGLVSLVLTATLSSNDLDLTPEQRQEILSGFGWRDFLEPTAVPLSVLGLCMTLALSGVTAFLNAYADTLGLEAAVAWYFAVYAAVLFVTRGFFGRLLDRRGENIVVYPTLACMAVSYLVLAFCANEAALFASAFLLGLGYGNALSTLQAVTVKRVDSYHVGLATSTFYVFADFGTGVGPMVVGLFIPLLGYAGSFVLLAVFSVVILAAYHIAHGRTIANGSARKGQ